MLRIALFAALLAFAAANENWLASQSDLEYMPCQGESGYKQDSACGRSFLPTQDLKGRYFPSTNTPTIASGCGAVACPFGNGVESYICGMKVTATASQESFTEMSQGQAPLPQFACSSSTECFGGEAGKVDPSKLLCCCNEESGDCSMGEKAGHECVNGVYTEIKTATSARWTRVDLVGQCKIDAQADSNYDTCDGVSAKWLGFGRKFLKARCTKGDFCTKKCQEFATIDQFADKEDETTHTETHLCCCTDVQTGTQCSTGRADSGFCYQGEYIKIQKAKTPKNVPIEADQAFFLVHFQDKRCRRDTAGVSPIIVNPSACPADNAAAFVTGAYLLKLAVELGGAQVVEHDHANDGAETVTQMPGVPFEQASNEQLVAAAGHVAQQLVGQKDPKTDADDDAEDGAVPVTFAYAWGNYRLDERSLYSCSVCDDSGSAPSFDQCDVIAKHFNGRVNRAAVETPELARSTCVFRNAVEGQSTINFMTGKLSLKVTETMHHYFSAKTGKIVKKKSLLGKRQWWFYIGVNADEVNDTCEAAVEITLAAGSMSTVSQVLTATHSVEMTTCTVTRRLVDFQWEYKVFSTEEQLQQAIESQGDHALQRGGVGFSGNAFYFYFNSRLRLAATYTEAQLPIEESTADQMTQSVHDAGQMPAPVDQKDQAVPEFEEYDGDNKQVALKVDTEGEFLRHKYTRGGLMAEMVQLQCIATGAKYTEVAVFEASETQVGAARFSFRMLPAKFTDSFFEYTVGEESAEQATEDTCVTTPSPINKKVPKKIEEFGKGNSCYKAYKSAVALCPANVESQTGAEQMSQEDKEDKAACSAECDLAIAAYARACKLVGETRYRDIFSTEFHEAFNNLEGNAAKEAAAFPTNAAGELTTIALDDKTILNAWANHVENCKLTVHGNTFNEFTQSSQEAVDENRIDAKQDGAEQLPNTQAVVDRMNQQAEQATDFENPDQARQVGQSVINPASQNPATGAGQAEHPAQLHAFTISAKVTANAWYQLSHVRMISHPMPDQKCKKSCGVNEDGEQTYACGVRAAGSAYIRCDEKKGDTECLALSDTAHICCCGKKAVRWWQHVIFWKRPFTCTTCESAKQVCKPNKAKCDGRNGALRAAAAREDSSEDGEDSGVVARASIVSMIVAVVLALIL